MTEPLLKNCGTIAQAASSEHVHCSEIRKFTAGIKASGITTGATVAIKGLDVNDSIFEIDSRTISANGNTAINFEGTFKSIYFEVSAYTDGSFLLSLSGVA